MLSLNVPHTHFYRPQGSLTRLIFSRMARQAAVTLIHLFSPVYIYQTFTSEGFSHTYSILPVFLYYMIVVVTKLITQNFSEDLSRKIGFKNVIRASVIPFIVFVLLLSLAPRLIPLFFLAAMFWGIHAGFYWWGYHGYFIKKGERKHFGTTVGEANVLETIASVVTPILGALLISYFGFEALFLFASSFMVLSIAMLGKGSKTRQKHDIRFRDILSLVTKHKFTSIAYIGMAGEAIVAVIIWPLFLYLFFDEVLSLGIVISISALMASVFSVIIGNKVDIEGERSVVGSGSILLFASWFVRIVNKNLPTFVIGDSLRNFGNRMVSLPLNALSYKKALESESAKAILYYETTQIIGVVIALLLLTAIVLAGFNLSASFILASFFGFFPLIWVTKKNNEKKKR